MQRFRKHLVFGLLGFAAVAACILWTTSSAIPASAQSGEDDALDDLATDVELDFTGIDTDHQMVIYHGWTNCDGFLYFIDDRRTLYAWGGGTEVEEIGDFYVPGSLNVLNGKVYFMDDDPQGGRLVSVDYVSGSFNTTTIFSGFDFWNPWHGSHHWFHLRKTLAVHEDALYIMAERGIQDPPHQDVWEQMIRYDPSDGSTDTVWHDKGSTSGDMLRSAGEYVYFYAIPRGGHYRELYSYHKDDGVTPIKHGVLRPTNNINNFADLKGVAYFEGKSNQYGSEIWRSDGTDDGTEVVDMTPGSAGSTPVNIVAVNNKLFFYKWNDNPRKLYTAYLNDDGVVTKDTVKVVKQIHCEWLDAANNTLFFHVPDPNGGFYRSDGTGHGAVRLTDKHVTGVGVLDGRLLVNNLESSSQSLMTSQATPTNVGWVGLRSSSYGIQDDDANPPFKGDPGVYGDPEYSFPLAAQWEAAAKATSSYFPGSEAKPTIAWIISRPRVDLTNDDDNKGGCILQMDAPSGSFDGKIYFNEQVGSIPGDVVAKDYHEDYLDYFDAAGINIYVQVEPGWAPMEDVGSTKGLLTAVLDHFIREDQTAGNPIHECVEGIGIDIEWFENCEPGQSHEGTVWNREDEVARWYDRIYTTTHTSQPNRHLKMFIKHWKQDYMPDYGDLETELGKLGFGSEHLGNIMFINDSQGAIFYSPGGYLDNPGSVNGKHAGDALGSLKNDFIKNWANVYEDSPVGYQIAYPNDWDSPNKTASGWLHYLDNDDDEVWGEGGVNGQQGQNAVPKDEAWKLIAKLGYQIADWVQNSNNNTKQVALFYVDFRARMLYEHDVADADWETEDGPGIFEWRDYDYPAWVDNKNDLKAMTGDVHEEYYVDDLVTHDGKTWRCKQRHEPVPTKEPGASGGDEYWEEDGFSGLEPWEIGVWYDVGDEVIYDGNVWECVYAHTSQVDWYPGAPGLWFWEEQ